MAVLALLASLAPAAPASEPVIAGYRDFSYGATLASSPTGEKPESKLWWCDGQWWGSLWDEGSARYEIHRFDPLAQSWSSTDTPIDDRAGSKADVLWDGVHLYVLSHVFAASGSPADSANSGRLYRFNYDPLFDSYALDAGFPVNVNASRSETLVLDKDSNGRLWVTWVEGGRVKVNRSLADDASWGTPFDLPVQAAVARHDDISSVIAFGGDKIGIMWSDQNTLKFYFSVHLDGNPDDVWEAPEDVMGGLGPLSDDHVNLKTFEGAVYAVTKANRSGAAASPSIFLFRRDADGAWSSSLFGSEYTRGILLIDEERRLAYVVARKMSSSNPAIFAKSARLTDLVFREGLGTPFIRSAGDREANNPTSTKQAVSRASGLLVQASDQTTRYYLHNFVDTLVEAASQATAGSLLLRSSPNPFHPSTRIRFELPASGRARLAIYDLGGRLVRTLVNEVLSAGPHAYVWQGDDRDGRLAPCGAYVARLTVEGAEGGCKVVRIR